MGAGRFVCVIIPFAMTLASLVCIFVAMLAGTANHSLDMFDIQTKNLSISSSSLLNIAHDVKREAQPNIGGLTTAALGPNAVNITATDLNLADSYKVSLWNYCSIKGSQTNCTKAKYNWAASSTNVTALEKTASTKVNSDVKLPKELSSALKTFTVVTRWTQVVYSFAIVLTFIELVVGIFGFFSRIGSCVTYIISGLASTAIIVASIMATSVSSISVGAIKTVAKSYGVQATINARFLGITWLAAIFSVGAGLFWLFSTCCCGVDHHKNSNKRGSHGDREKLIPSGQYHHIENPHQTHSGQYGPTGGIPMQTRGNGAYEPYSQHV